MPDLTSFIPGLAQTAIGIGQTLFSGVKKKERALEKFNENSPKYQQNQSILDYYDKALAKYNPNAYNSAAYRQGKTNIDSNVATGIGALQDRRSGVAGISNLIANANRASLGNIANAESIQSHNLSQLGAAAHAKLGEDRMAFKINQQDPFERKYNLLAMKAAQAAKQKNDGLQNIFGGISNAGSLLSNKSNNNFSNATGYGSADVGGNFLTYPRFPRKLI